tara:strand:- start:246 stop:653 length:408 start_codon:yes stop_codon:yes gene_type:complete
MNGCLKNCLIAGGFAATTFVVGVIYLLKSWDVFFDQRLSEQYGLLNCYSQIASGKFSSTSQCSKYARHHMYLYPEYLATTPEKSVCLTSQGILTFLKIEYPSQLDEIRVAEARAKRNCTAQKFGQGDGRSAWKLD